ncbi:PRTRC system protein C [Hoylesella timonensis]|jgi:PRTRC genetic system protein C|uniref:PRTRC system protein C n=1 Tax=Hoylesella timonensis TaxID=386414 RepID=A0A2K0XPH8_9BACT|nr:PRTRC system protein C [Hoylesella timonensis]PNP96440.1 PRTRC system protein C [Hoylesella timonensis]
MALNLTGLKRVFKFGNRTLSDPDKSMTPDEVMNFYAGTYPELTTSNVHGPKVEDGQAVYEFKTTVGTKG